jgi:putative ABC transport system ATP-binding protein
MTSNPVDDALIKGVGLHRRYCLGGREVPALQGVDLSISPGKLVALKGRSGSGKTTLLNIIGGLDKPTSGEVFFEGQSLGLLNGTELTSLRRRRIGFVFQSFSLLSLYSAYENVELVLRIVGLTRKEQKSRARECLILVGLEKWMQHRPAEMSGGQQQRVVIARALASKPDLILADEPTGELDSETSQEIFALFRRIVDGEGTTVLVATHDPHVDLYADHLMLIEDGRIKDARTDQPGRFRLP